MLWYSLLSLCKSQLFPSPLIRNQLSIKVGNDMGFAWHHFSIKTSYFALNWFIEENDNFKVDLCKWTSNCGKVFNREFFLQFSSNAPSGKFIETVKQRSLLHWTFTHLFIVAIALPALRKSSIIQSILNSSSWPAPKHTDLLIERLCNLKASVPGIACWMISCPRPEKAFLLFGNLPYKKIF